MSKNVHKFLQFFDSNVSRIPWGMSKILKLSATLKNLIRNNNQPLKTIQNSSFFCRMYRKLVNTHLLVIIKSPVTSSDMTSRCNRTLEMKKLDQRCPLAKFHDYYIISLGFRGHSNYPIFLQKKLKSEKIRSNPRTELMGVPLTVNWQKVLRVQNFRALRFTSFLNNWGSIWKPL